MVAGGSRIGGLDDEAAGPGDAVVVVGGDGGADGFEDFGGGGAFNGEGGLGVGNVFEGDVVGNDVFVEVGEDGLALGGFDVEEKVLGLGEDGDVGQDAALGGEEEGVAALAGFELLDVVGGHGVEEAFAVLAMGLDAAAAGEFEEGGGFEEGVRHGIRR